jgi:RNA-splicing ligase RtcB
MLELQGKYNSAKIFTDVVDSESISQVLLLLNQEFVSGSKIRMMPDIHAGSGCTVGTTMTITDKIVPNLVGVDIGCGMYTAQIKEKEIDFEKLDNAIHALIPSGFAIREKPHRFAKQIDLNTLSCYTHTDPIKAEKSIGSLGGGNHFIECDRDDEGNLYIVIHSGSRHLGLEVASYYQRAGYDALNGASKEDINALIADLKSKGKQREIEQAIKTLKNTKRTSIPKNLCYVQGDLFTSYIHDTQIVQMFADLNRKAMMDEIINAMGLTVVDEFSTIHNYIDVEHMILRKGSVSARKGEKLLIPINMRDGSLICIGKGNDDWNQSAPHGAGRLMSRTEAKNNLSLEEFQNEMQGIYSTSVSTRTIDESPMAYKSMSDIVDNIKDTADILKVIKPVYNFKAGEER